MPNLDFKEQNKDIDLIQRYLEAETSDEETAEVEIRLAKEKEFKQKFEIQRQYFILICEAESDIFTFAEKEIIFEKPSQNQFNTLFLIGFFVIILVVISFLVWIFYFNPKKGSKKIHTKNDNKVQILPNNQKTNVTEIETETKKDSLIITKTTTKIDDFAIFITQISALGNCLSAQATQIKNLNQNPAQTQELENAKVIINQKLTGVEKEISTKDMEKLLPNSEINKLLVKYEIQKQELGAFLEKKQLKNASKVMFQSILILYNCQKIMYELYVKEDTRSIKNDKMYIFPDKPLFLPDDFVSSMSETEFSTKYISSFSENDCETIRKNNIYFTKIKNEKLKNLKDFVQDLK